MNYPLQLLRTSLFLLIFFSLYSCEEGSLDNQDPLILRDIDLQEECKNVCEGVILDFMEFEEFDRVRESKGVKISASLINDRSKTLQARIFDTVDPERCLGFNDDDLYFPDGPFGNVLIIQQVNKKNLTCANDNRDGGLIRFDFAQSFGTVTVNCLDLLDTEERGQLEGQAVSGGIRLLNANEEEIAFVPIPGIPDGTAQVVEVGVSGVAAMEMEFLGSGAISNICFTPEEQENICGDDSMLLDFDDLDENQLVSEYQGVKISGSPTDVISFDSVDPQMCEKFNDDDLIHTAPIPGFDPDFTFGTVLVLKHRANLSCANDDPRGGTMTFEFPEPVMVNSATLFDTDDPKGKVPNSGEVTFFDSDGNVISMVEIPVIEDGDFQILSFDAVGVTKMEVKLLGSGAVDNICYKNME